MRIIAYVRLLNLAMVRRFSPKHFTRIFVSLLFPIFIYFLSVSEIAFQDVSGRGPGALSDDLRWSAHLIKVPTGSTFSATMGGDAGSANTGTVEYRSQVKTLGQLPGSQQRPKLHAASGGLPMVINRTLKGDRVLSSPIKRPPASFSAGSVIRKSNLLDNTLSKVKKRLTFKKLRWSISPVQLAGIFLHRNPVRTKVGTKIKASTMIARAGLRLKATSRPTTLVAFAPIDDSEKPFRSLFRNSGKFYSKPVLGRGDHKWAANQLPKRTKSKGEQYCLAAGIYFEARGESLRGQAAVAQVILNRVKNPAYPNSICGVVYQNKSWKNRCQFSFACDGVRDRVTSKKSWRSATIIARKATAGELWIKEIGSATHYYATSVRPRWAKSMKRMQKIGRHIFYRTYGGGWS